MLSGVPWYVAARYVALGVFMAADAYLWRWAGTGAPSHRRGKVVVAAVGLVVVVGTLLVDILLPGEGLRGARYVAFGTFVMADVIFWWQAVTSPPSRRPFRLPRLCCSWSLWR